MYKFPYKYFDTITISFLNTSLGHLKTNVHIKKHKYNQATNYLNFIHGINLKMVSPDWSISAHQYFSFVHFD